MWTDGENDRDHHDAVYHEGSAVTVVPCIRCRGPVEIDPRTDSIFATHACDSCHRLMQQTQFQKAAQGKDAA